MLDMAVHFLGPVERVHATVRQLASGADLTFEGRGAHDLKGLSGPRELFAVATPA